jgi:putative MATE family efflux protein
MAHPAYPLSFLTMTTPLARFSHFLGVIVVFLSLYTHLSSGFCPWARQGSKMTPKKTKHFGTSLLPQNASPPTEGTSLLAQSSPDDDSISAEDPSTGQQILSLAVPALGALLIDPLMTLADTAFVGRFATTTDALAGMGSAAALLNFFFYLFGFFCTATTPLVSSRRSAGLESEAVSVGGQALTFSLLTGTLVASILLLLQQPLLTLMGTNNTGNIANAFALDFLRIRALAAPAVLCISASTGVLRGYLDTRTPVVILVAANLLNFLLDVVLIAGLDMGPKGAAIATTTAEWISAGLFLGVLSGKLPTMTKKEASASVPLQVTPALTLPPLEDIQPLLVASASLFLRSVTLQLALSSAAALAARSSDASTSLAAHQIAIQLWLLCSFICDALAAASQALVADSLGRQDQASARTTSWTVFSYSAALGVILAIVLQLGGESSTLLLDLFTTDSQVKQELSEILVLIILAQPLNSLVFAADGVLQGASEFAFQAKSMALSAGVALLAFVGLQQMDGGDGNTLMHVWSGLIALQFMRGLTSVVKIVDRDGPLDLFQLRARKSVDG